MDNPDEKIFKVYDKSCVLEENLTWQQIKEKYPHQQVGLVNIISNTNNGSVIRADVLCTSKNTDYDDMCVQYIQGKIDMRYTTLDEDMQMGVCPWAGL